jgi:5'-3' exonuclease
VILQENEEKLQRERFRAQGKEVLPKETCEVSDSIVITPGTEFMKKLSKALRVLLPCSIE